MVIKLIKLLMNNYYPLVKIEPIFTTEIERKSPFRQKKTAIKLIVNNLQGNKNRN